ncbi:MAG: DciA family protein [Proteobacteria bacterium]|nr:DciA family protein [Pseudomonadota bacterium]
MSRSREPTTRAKYAQIPRSVRSTGQILKGANHILHSLYAQSRKLTDITTIVREAGSADASVSAFKNKELVLITASGAAASRIRYRQQNIIDALGRAGIEVNRVRVKVDPGYFKDPAPVVERHLSEHSARNLESTAEHIEDPDLKHALKKLAERARND